MTGEKNNIQQERFDSVWPWFSKNYRAYIKVHFIMMDPDDFRQLIAIAVWEACGTWDDTQASLRYWCDHIIRCHLHNEAKRWCRDSKMIHIDDPEVIDLQFNYIQKFPNIDKGIIETAFSRLATSRIERSVVHLMIRWGKDWFKHVRKKGLTQSQLKRYDNARTRLILKVSSGKLEHEIRRVAKERNHGQLLQRWKNEQRVRGFSGFAAS